MPSLIPDTMVDCHTHLRSFAMTKMFYDTLLSLFD